MPAPYLNTVTTQAGYVDALTVVFTQPRDTFQVQCLNNAIVYQLGTPNPSAREPNWEAGEHDLVPSLTVFDGNDAAALGDNKLAGIRIKSKVAASPAIVTVS